MPRIYARLGYLIGQFPPVFFLLGIALAAGASEFNSLLLFCLVSTPEDL